MKKEREHIALLHSKVLQAFNIFSSGSKEDLTTQY